MHQATERQIKYFFVLCHDLGYDSTEAKERAKKKFNLEHFNDITTDQLSLLIDLLLKKVEKKDEEYKEQDKKIVEAGHLTTVCTACGEECVVTASLDNPPVCTRLRCVRKWFAKDIK